MWCIERVYAMPADQTPAFSRPASPSKNTCVMFGLLLASVLIVSCSDEDLSDRDFFFSFSF